MEGTKKNSLEQLECCQKYFYHASTAEAQDFYQHLRILIDCLTTTSAELGRPTREILEDICVSLLQTLVSCNLQLDGQILCSTAFCSTLQTVLESQEINDIVCSFLHTENILYLPFHGEKFRLLEENLDIFKVCFIHGILQSIALSTLVQSHFIMFDYIEKTCMKYTRLTNISFKVLVSWTSKVYLSMKLKLSVDILRRIFSIINSNWESPINGVKEQNVKMFELFLDVCIEHTLPSCEFSDGDEVFESVANLLCHVMKEQPWKMKSKYFMLTSLLPRYGVKKAFLEFPDLVHGLISSISQNHLTPAGTDLYKSCLKNLLIDDWVNIFMAPVVEVLTDKTQVVSVGKQNMFNYWIPVTIKMFPSLLNILLEELLDITDNWENNVFAIISLIKLGRKTGKLLNIWDEEFELKDLSLADLLRYTMEHCSKVVRAEAFALVCSCTKRTVVPTDREFELIKMFLSNNVSIDSAFLRQAVLNSFTLFLLRVLDSSLYEMKKVEKMEVKGQSVKISDSSIIQNVNFLEWLHKFLKSNLQPGVNYQRKILSLHLYKTVLYYLDDKGKKEIGLRKQDLDQFDKAKLVRFASKLGKWHYISESSQKILLSCILDSTEDVREAAGFILSEYFIFKKESSDGYKRLFDFALNLCNRPIFFEAESGALLVKVIGNVTNKLPERNYVINDIMNGKIRYKDIKPHDDSNLIASRGYGSIMILNNQEKLLSALEKRKGPFPTKEEKMKNISNLKVNVKVPTGTYEGCIMKDPSLIQTKDGEELPEETRIFENLTCISKDGLVGQCTNSELKELSPPGSRCNSIHQSSKRNESRFPHHNEIAKDKGARKNFWISSTGSQYPNVTTIEVDEQTNIAPMSMLKFQSPHPEIKSSLSREDDLHSSNREKAKRFQNKQTHRHQVFGEDACKNSIISKEDWSVEASHETQRYQVTEEYHFKNSVVGKDDWWSNETEHESQRYQVTKEDPFNNSVVSKDDWWSSAAEHKTQRFQVTGENPFKNSKASKDVWWSNEAEHETWRLKVTGEDSFKNSMDSIQYAGRKYVKSRNDKSSKGTGNRLLYKKYKNCKESRENSRNPFRDQKGESDYNVDEQSYSTQKIIMNGPAKQVEEVTRYKSKSSTGSCSVMHNSDSKPFNDWIKEPQSSVKGSHSNSLRSEELSFQEWIAEPNAFKNKQQDSVTENTLPPLCRQLEIRKQYPTPSHDNYKGTPERILPKNVSNASLAPISLYLVSEAELQLQHLTANIFQAATSGSPLYGTLMALSRLSVQSDSAEYGKMTAMEVERTTEVLEKTVTHLLSLLAEKSSMGAGIAPSFAEMDEAIKNNIQDLDDDDDMHLSPAHQLLLNCVWLNLKTSCTLASGLPCNKTSSMQVIKSCGNIITQVLTRCRHKGAIESAGVALTNFVKTVKSYHSPDIVQTMLEDLLTEFLVSLVHGYGRGSVTRRSAGFSILIQRIITSDTLPSKPLLQVCLKKLLKIAKTPLDPLVILNPESVLTDLPQAQSLHFLRILVQDSSLRQDIAQYMSAIAIICFSKFTSPVWTIRNAALQLSGSLIPKLVGQKKIQDEDITLGSSISAEELFSHFPDLTDFMLKSLEEAVDVDNVKAFQQHSDLVPMLSLLAKVAVGVHFINNQMTLKINQFRHCFQKLLSSPIYHVRKLAAKTYERFVPLSDTYGTITDLVNRLNASVTCKEKNCHCHQENEVNGILLALKYHVEKLKYESKNVKEIELYLHNIGTLLKEIANYDRMYNLYTYFNKLLLNEILEGYIEAEDTIYNPVVAFERILEVHRILVDENIEPSFRPGLILWAANRIEETLKKCTPDELVITWYNSYMLFSSYPDIIKSAFSRLKLRIQNDQSIKAASKSSLAISLLKIISGISNNYPPYTLYPIFDMMLSLLENRDINIVVSHKDVQTLTLVSLSDEAFRCEYSIIALPVVSGLLAQFLIITHSSEFLLAADLKLLLDLTNCINERSDESKYDEEYRLNVAKAVNFLASPLRTIVAPELRKHIKNASRNKILKIMHTNLNVVLHLLQDEDQEVRNEAAKFFANYSDNRAMMLSPYSTLQRILGSTVLLEFFPLGEACDFLLKKLLYKEALQDLKDKKLKTGCITSPFDHGTKNIYSEEVKIVDLIGKSLLSQFKNANAVVKRNFRMKLKFGLNSFSNDASTISSMLDDIETCGISSVSSEHTAYYIIAKKIIYISEIKAALDIKLSCDIECVIQSLKQKIAV